MQIPPSSPPEAIMIDDAEEENNGMPFAPPQDDSMMIDDSIQQISPGFGFMKSLGLGGGLGGSGLGSSRFDSPRGNKRSRGDAWAHGEPVRPPRRLVGAVASRAPSREEGLKSRANCKARTRVNLGHISRKVRLQPPHKMRGQGQGVGLGAVIPAALFV